MTNNVLNGGIAYNSLKRGLDASYLRSKVIANNISNINTKGYKRFYVTFENTLKNSIENVNMLKTDKKHFKNDGETGDISIKQDKSTSMRSDGNNVDIENEMVNVSANNMMYNTLVSQANTRLSMRKYVINGR